MEKFQKYFNFWGLFAIVFIFSLGFIEVFISEISINRDTMLLLVGIFYSFLMVIFYYYGKLYGKDEESKNMANYWYDKGVAHGIYRMIENYSIEEYNDYMDNLEKDKNFSRKTIEIIKACKRNAERLFTGSKIDDEEYTRRAKELNEKEKGNPEQEKRNIQWMRDSEQIKD